MGGSSGLYRCDIAQMTGLLDRHNDSGHSAVVIKHDQCSHGAF
jgi:hypothetical protein